MTTRKNTVSPLAMDAAAAAVSVRYSVGAAELALAADAARADAADAKSAVAIFDLIFGDFPKGHGVTLHDLRKLNTGERRSNSEAAAYAFTRHFHALRRCGADCAAKLLDANIKGETILQKDGINPHTLAAYKPQSKRQILQSIYNSDDWGAFVSRMAAIAEARDKAAKVAAGLITEAEADAPAKRGTGSKKTERERVLKMVSDLCTLLRKSVDKRDGSVDAEVGAAFATVISDQASAHGFK